VSLLFSPPFFSNASSQTSHTDYQQTHIFLGSLSSLVLSGLSQLNRQRCSSQTSSTFRLFLLLQGS
jgi:hypothetical protein